MADTSDNRQRRFRANEASGKIPEEYIKLPPQALELEEAVLGSLMIEKDAFSVVCDVLKEDCFYKEANRTIFKAINTLAQLQQPIDILTVCEQLKKEKTLKEVGGEYYVTQLTSKVNSAVHIEYHARILAQKALARQMISFATDISKDAYDPNTDIDALVQRAEGMLFEIATSSAKRDFTDIQPVIKEAIKRIEDASKRSDGMSGIPSGFTELDKMTSGWQRSDLVIIAARPAMGKTAFVLSMARNMAEAGNPIAVFSLEMANVQLVNRLLVNVCEIAGEKIKNGKLSSEDWTNLMQRSRKLEEMPIYLDDSAGLSVMELNTKARRLVKEHDVRCIIIDYLQLMNASGMKFGSREQEVSMISRSLKQLAKELDIPIIALSQLNRSVEKKEAGDKRPQLSDLRESGAIEQDADMVLFIHRPEYYKITEDATTRESLKGIAEIIIAKHRNGATGDVRLRFRNELARFQNLDEGYLDGDNAPRQVFQSKMNDSDSPTASFGAAEELFGSMPPLGGGEENVPY